MNTHFWHKYDDPATMEPAAVGDLVILWEKKSFELTVKDIKVEQGSLEDEGKPSEPIEGQPADADIIRIYEVTGPGKVVLVLTDSYRTPGKDALSKLVWTKTFSFVVPAV